ncbi:MAG: hypothetical protein ACRC5H_03720 [Treponemataceae bacterium]
MMKKRFLSLFMVSLVAFTISAQLPEGMSAENTVQVEFGTDAEPGAKFQLYHLREQFDLFYTSEKVDFVGRIRLQIATDFSDYFAFGSTANGEWNYKDDLKATARIRPFRGLEFGVGTDIDWEAGSRSIWDDSENRYAVNYGSVKSAGLWDVFRTDLYGSSGFGTRFIFGGFTIGAGVPFQYVDEPSDFQLQLGTRFLLPDIFSVGFAWTGDFSDKDYAKNPWGVYLGGSLDFIPTLNIEIFANYVHYRNNFYNKRLFATGEFNLGGRIVMDFKVIKLAPEFAITFFDKIDSQKDNFRNIFFIAIPLDIYFGQVFSAGITVAYATGDKAKNELGDSAFDSKVTFEPRVAIDLKTSKIEVSVPIDFQKLESHRRDFFTGFAAKVAWITRF